MLKDNNYHNMITYFSSAIIIALFLGATLFAQTPNSDATEQLAVLSVEFSADDIEKFRSLINAGADVNVINEIGCTPMSFAP